MAEDPSQHCRAKGNGGRVQVNSPAGVGRPLYFFPNLLREGLVTMVEGGEKMSKQVSQGD